MAPQTSQDALTVIARKLNDLAVPWMLTGSVAAFIYGRDRSTVDIDIVIGCARLIPGELVRSLEPEYFLDEQMVRDSLRSGEMFNAIPMTGGPKIDFIPLKPDPFEQTAFRRRASVDWHGTILSVATGKDLVISKLRWARESLSERQLADVRAIMSLGLVDEDEDFRRWVARLGLGETLDASRETRYDA